MFLEDFELDEAVIDEEGVAFMDVVDKAWIVNVYGVNWVVILVVTEGLFGHVEVDFITF